MATTPLAYGILLNESVNGSVRFMVTNGAAGQATVALTNANYADGQWHYLLAVYDTLSGTNGQLRLTVVNTNGAENSALTDLLGGFSALPVAMTAIYFSDDSNIRSPRSIARFWD